VKITRETVAVVTGASSGIGRATAYAFARRGAAVVLAARRADALQDAARECQELGGRAIAVPTDVADESAVDLLARRAVEAFGRIDVWVNNAGVYLLGRVEDTPGGAFRRLVEVNLLGSAYGAKAAVPRFRRQGAGVLVNVASVNGKVGVAYTGAYCASKFAMVGLSDVLRQEVADVPDIHVCTVLPGVTDTPIFRSTANYSGRAVKLPSPSASPEDVAEVVVGCVESPRREATVNTKDALMVASERGAPAVTERMARRYGEANFEDRPAPPDDGNLYTPDPTPAVSGGLRSGGGGLGVAALLGGVAAVGLGVWLARSGAGGGGDRPRAGRPNPATHPEAVF
jgi:NAD(P)-dependent dehydrogenase (short-subunit alcohol dehydrogenase family)